MNQLHDAFTLFLSLLVEAMPFLLLGVLLSSGLLFLISEKQLIAKLPKNPLLGSLVGSCIGFLFPVCECGNVPLARRLLLTGVSPSVAISFLLAAPTINPIVIWATWIAFGDRPSIVICRVLFSSAIATIVGCVFSIQPDARELLQTSFAKRLKPIVNIPPNKSLLLQSGTFLLRQGASIPFDDDLLVTTKLDKTSNFRTKWQLFFSNLLQEFSELGGILVLGSAIAVIIQVFIPREIVLGLGQDTITSIVAMMLLAAIVSICSTVDSFFALSFASTFTSGSLLAFLVFGPTIDIKSIGLMASIFKPKIIIYIFTLVAQLTFIFTLIYSYLL
ncbi:permease [Pleurocapsa sp. PCC 7319]|uniref:permease n=1 Tax=Pleurocapsa sp. PCC 7319 TaxID=118161 RepID=UPI00034BD66B|nr:permease [Pleurocapsa sp. PCC 7319]